MPKPFTDRAFIQCEARTVEMVTLLKRLAELGDELEQCNCSGCSQSPLEWSHARRKLLAISDVTQMYAEIIESMGFFGERPEEVVG